MVRNRKLPSVMNNRFSEAPQVSVQRSTFNRSCGYKTTFNAGDLIPIIVDEILPGDTFRLSHSLFGRIATPITPLMDNLHVDTFYFFVPSRLVWDNWQRFNGEQDNPNDSTDFLIPEVVIEQATADVGDLADYFGIPIQTLTQDKNVNALPFRAYNLVYNEWFRDQNLIDSAVVDKDDGPDSISDYVIRKRNKRHDYFTSCLPWPQKGPAVNLPLGSQAPIVYGDAFNESGSVVVNGENEYLNFRVNGLSNITSMRYGTTLGADDGPLTSGLSGGIANFNAFADLSDATASTINDIRLAFQVQRLLERDARGGTRYTEILRAHFGVTSPDGRLQRPEYLGGSSRDVLISPIPQTSETTTESPQGNLAAYGTFSDVKKCFNHSFTEHGYLIGLVSVRADLTYQQGLDRFWSRSTRFDFYWPALSHLGEQAVLRQEIFCTGDESINDLEVFGFQERYAEYRYKPSLITANFRSGVSDSLDIWHLSQNFASAPELNQSFIEENPPMSRVKAVGDFPDFILDAYFDLKCTRPMPVYSIPGYVDHF